MWRPFLVVVLFAAVVAGEALAQTIGPAVQPPRVLVPSPSIMTSPQQQRVPRAPPDQAFYQRVLSPILRDLGAEGARQWAAGERSGSVVFRPIENSSCRAFDLTEVRAGAPSARDAVTGQVCPGEDGALRITTIRYVVSYDTVMIPPMPRPLEDPLPRPAPRDDSPLSRMSESSERARRDQEERAQAQRRAATEERAQAERRAAEQARRDAGAIAAGGIVLGGIVGGNLAVRTPVIVEIGRAQPRVAANGGSAVVLMASATETRNRTLCRELWDTTGTASYAQALIGVRRENGVTQALRPVYWLTSEGAPDANARPEARTCNARLSTYDFNRAQVIRDKYGLTGAGPHLLVTRADEQAAAVINLEGRSDREIAGLVRFFRNGFAQEADIWSPERKPETFRSGMAAALAEDFREGLLAGLSLIVAPSARAGCLLGDLGDTPCQP